MIKKLKPYLYILPAAIIIFAFRVVPIFISFLVSFFRWSITGVQEFIFLKNYIELFSDFEFWKSLLNTFNLVILVIPLTMIFSLIFATLLNGIKRFRGFFRTLYFIPMVTSLVAVSIVWKIIFTPGNGLANHFLTFLGFNPLAWLAESRGIFDIFFTNLGLDFNSFIIGISSLFNISENIIYSLFGGPSLALFCIIIVCIWKSVGYCTIIYLTGIQNIPQVYYEAAEIDGASKLRQFFGITIPLISPTTFYILLTTTITTFQVFSQIYLMTGPPVGGPLGTTKVIVYYIFDKGFGESQNLSFASAVALILFIIIYTITALLKKLEKKVHY